MPKDLLDTEDVDMEVAGAVTGAGMIVDVVYLVLFRLESFHETPADNNLPITSVRKTNQVKRVGK